MTKKPHFHPYLGMISHFDSYFSKVLKPPTSSWFVLVVVFDTLIPTPCPADNEESPEAMGEQLETSVTLGMRSGAIGGLLSTSLGLGAVSNWGKFYALQEFWATSGVVVKDRDKALGWERENDAGDLEIGVIFL